MYKVTSLKPKKKNFLITVEDGKNLKDYLVSEELILDFRLVKGKELSESDFQKFLKAQSKDTIYQKILHFALFKQRCTHDIIEYFERLGVPEDDFKYYLHKLYASKVLDDESYVSNYISESFELKLNGPRKIVFELENKRIRKELYQDIIADISNKKILENITNLFEKKLHSIKPQSVNKTILTVKQFLINKGYEFEDIDLVINENRTLIESKSKEDNALDKDFQYALNKYKDEGKKKYEKIYGYLLRKGYAYHKIKAKMGEYYDE